MRTAPGGGELDFVLHEWEHFFILKNNGIFNSLSSVEYIQEHLYFLY